MEKQVEFKGSWETDQGAEVKLCNTCPWSCCLCCDLLTESNWEEKIYKEKSIWKGKGEKERMTISDISPWHFFLIFFTVIDFLLLIFIFFWCSSFSFIFFVFFRFFLLLFTFLFDFFFFLLKLTFFYFSHFFSFYSWFFFTPLSFWQDNEKHWKKHMKKQKKGKKYIYTHQIREKTWQTSFLSLLFSYLFSLSPCFFYHFYFLFRFVPFLPFS